MIITFLKDEDNEEELINNPFIIRQDEVGACAITFIGYNRLVRKYKQPDWKVDMTRVQP